MVLEKKREKILWNKEKVNESKKKKNIDVGRIIKYRKEIGKGKKRRVFRIKEMNKRREKENGEEMRNLGKEEKKIEIGIDGREERKMGLEYLY